MVQILAIDPDRLAHELEQTGLDWADKQAAYEALDGVTKSLLGRLYLAAAGTVAEREAEARTDPEYTTHMNSVVAAHHAATRAKVRYDTMRVKIELIRTQAATQRQQMALV